MTKAKWIDLMFEVDDGDKAFVELRAENKTASELITEGKQLLRNNFHRIKFLGFYTDERINGSNGA